MVHSSYLTRREKLNHYKIPKIEWVGKKICNFHRREVYVCELCARASVCLPVYVCVCVCVHVCVCICVNVLWFHFIFPNWVFTSCSLFLVVHTCCINVKRHYLNRNRKRRRRPRCRCRCGCRLSSPLLRREKKQSREYMCARQRSKPAKVWVRYKKKKRRKEKIKTTK